MRICIVNEFFWPDNAGGTGTVLSELARVIRARHEDVEIDVITSRNLYRTPPAAAPKSKCKSAAAPDAASDAASLPASEDWKSIRIRRIASPRPNGLPTPLRLIANLMFSYGSFLTLLRSNRYDLVLVATAPPMAALAASLYRWIKKVPFVYAVYDLEPDRAVVLSMISASHPAAGLLRSQQLKWFRSASKVIVLGRCMRDYLQAQYGVPREKIAVIPVGADHNEIEPRSKKTEFRAEHDLHGFVVLYSGNFGRYHDFDTILNAAKKLAELRSDVKFVLVGGGWQRKRVEQRVADENISNVLVQPFVPSEAYSDLLASADASLVTLEPGMDGLCVPSKFYSILASGRPTIAVVPRSMEVGLTIDEAECGLRIDHGDVDAMVRAVLTLASNPDRAERMGANARTVLIEKYTTEAAADAFYKAFVEATGGRHATPKTETRSRVAERLTDADHAASHQPT